MFTKINNSNRYRRAAAAILLASGVTGLAAAAEIEYELFILSPFGTSTLGEAYVEDINDDGMAVGRATDSTYNAFYWTEETGMINLAPGPFVTSAEGVNSSGEIVGDNRHWLDLDTFIGIPSLSSYYFTTHAFDIADNGMIVGESVHIYHSDSSAQTAFVWDSDNGMRDLASLGVPSASAANAVNELGQIVGETNVTGAFSNTRAFYFDLTTSQYVDLGTFNPGLTGYASAKDINADSVVVGRASSLDDPRAFRWTQTGGLENLGILGTYSSGVMGIGDLEFSQANGINDAGTIVGRSTVSTAASQWDKNHAFIYDEVNGMRDLNELVDRPEGYFLIDAKAISNSGWIVGTSFGSPGGGFYSSFVLKPLDLEPMVGDLDGDDSVGAADLALLLGAWGPCQNMCPADLDGSGAVNASDLAILLGNWG